MDLEDKLTILCLFFGVVNMLCVVGYSIFATPNIDNLYHMTASGFIGLLCLLSAFELT